jgi:uncharacterized protein YkwD
MYTIQKIAFSIAGFLFLFGIFSLYLQIDAQQKYTPISETTLSPNEKATSLTFKENNYEQKQATLKQTPQKQPATIIKQIESTQTQIISNKPKSADLRELELAVFNEINNVRQQYGIHPLRWDDQVAEVARKHSEDMARRNYYEHVSPEGKHPQDRINENHIDCYVGENLMLTYDTEIKHIIQSWLKSEGHKQNLLYADYDRTGVGTAANNMHVFITQDFCVSDKVVKQHKRQPEKMIIDFWPSQ